MCRFFQNNNRALRFLAFSFLVTAALVLIDINEHDAVKLLLLALLIISFDEGTRHRVAEEKEFDKVLRV